MVRAVRNNEGSTGDSFRSKASPLVKQIVGSMAIGLVLFVLVQAGARFAFGLETADAISSPLLLNLLALAAFPFVRKFMK